MIRVDIEHYIEYLKIQCQVRFDQYKTFCPFYSILLLFGCFLAEWKCLTENSIYSSKKIIKLVSELRNIKLMHWCNSGPILIQWFTKGLYLFFCYMEAKKKKNLHFQKFKQLKVMKQPWIAPITPKSRFSWKVIPLQHNKEFMCTACTWRRMLVAHECASANRTSHLYQRVVLFAGSYSIQWITDEPSNIKQSLQCLVKSVVN